MSKEVIKIAFCDTDKMFDHNSNFITEIFDRNGIQYEISSKPDFLFYMPFGTDHLRYNDCVKVFITNEAVTPDFNECDYAIGFDYITFGDRYFRRPTWFADERYYNNMLSISDEEALDRKFCNFIFFNTKDGDGAEFRQRFVKRLSEYKRVDCPGRVMNNMHSDKLIGRYDGDWRKSKIDFIKDYKFTIAFENVSYLGYTTEKMLHAVIARSIPIYWGNPIVDKEYNPASFIDCTGRENDIESVIDQIVELDNDDESYLHMLHEEPMGRDFDPNELKNLEKFILNIINKGNNPYNKDPRNWLKRMSVDNMGRADKIKYFLLKRI